MVKSCKTNANGYLLDTLLDKSTSSTFGCSGSQMGALLCRGGRGFFVLGVPCWELRQLKWCVPRPESRVPVLQCVIPVSNEQEPCSALAASLDPSPTYQVRVAASVH